MARDGYVGAIRAHIGGDLLMLPTTAVVVLNERDEILLVVPTIKTLEQLAEFPTADALLEWAEGRSVEPVEPKVIGDGPAARLVLPGEPGYMP